MCIVYLFQLYSLVTMSSKFQSTKLLGGESIMFEHDLVCYSYSHY